MLSQRGSAQSELGLCQATFSSTSSNNDGGVRILTNPYHMVSVSPWPFLVSLSLLGNITFLLNWMLFSLPFFCSYFATFTTGFVLFMWWRDVNFESVYEGQHTTYVTRGLRIGMLLFITSEVFFFVAFFWGYLHSALNPSIFIGGTWPPYGLIPSVLDFDMINTYVDSLKAPASKLIVTDVEPLARMKISSSWNPLNMPLSMTAILISSGLTLTASHVSLCHKLPSSDVSIPLVLTLVLAVLFLCLQAIEYVNLPISINDGVFGSTFFMATGFHGFHVFVGSIFLAVCYIRHGLHRFLTSDSHASYEFAIWYWHFVDVVWVGLFLLMYWWAQPPAYYLFFNAL